MCVMSLVSTSELVWVVKEYSPHLYSASYEAGIEGVSIVER